MKAPKKIAVILPVLGLFTASPAFAQPKEKSCYIAPLLMFYIPLPCFIQRGGQH